MGAATRLSDFVEILRTKRAPFLIGFCSQYLFMPLSALALSFVLSLESNIAVGLVLVGASPGGTTSQLFTYLSKGDIALSIAMTFSSTIASFVVCNCNKFDHINSVLITVHSVLFLALLDAVCRRQCRDSVCRYYFGFIGMSFCFFKLFSWFFKNNKTF